MAGPLFVRGDEVTFHPVEEADLDFLQEVVNHPAVRPGVASTDPVNGADEREWFESLGEDGVNFLVRVDGERVDVERYGLLVEEWDG
jgi:hypothetical protein